MLTADIIKKNIENISDEDVAKIVELSKNDEDATIGSKFGEVYRNLDSIIEKSTGVKRDGDEKTYFYLERAAKEISTKSNAKDAEIKRLLEENKRLTEKGDDGLKEKLEQANKDLLAVQKEYSKLQKQNEEIERKHQADLFSMQVDNEVKNAFNNVSFKKNISDSIRNLVKNQISEKIKSMQSSFIDDGNGGKIIAYKDNEGAIMRNPDKQLNPYSTFDLVEKELKSLGILASQEQVGTNTTIPRGETSVVRIDVNNAKTQNEAYEAAAAMLMQKGIANGTEQFETEMAKIWKENNFSNLPN